LSGDNLNVLRAKELISLLPGIHLRGLAKLLGLQLSTVRYHVSRLERDGKIVCSRDGEYLRTYPISLVEDGERRTYALLQHKTARKILKVLVKQSSVGHGVSNEELSTLTRLSGSTVSRYAGAFRDLGLVRKVPAKRGGWALEVDLEDRARLSTILSNLEKNLLSVVTDRYIDLWDF
jgi:predicted transcriptional regulator